MYEKELKEKLDLAKKAVDKQEKVVCEMSALDDNFMDEYSKLNNLRTVLETAKSRLKNRGVKGSCLIVDSVFLV